MRGRSPAATSLHVTLRLIVLISHVAPPVRARRRQWDIPELRQLLEAVIPKSTAVEGYEVEHDFPHLGRRIMRLDARRMFHPDHNGTTLLLAVEDITNGRRKEQEKDLLLGELQHRVRNLLALVHSLARRTGAEGRSGTEYRDAFLGRLGTLAEAHELAFEATTPPTWASWSGHPGALRRRPGAGHGRGRAAGGPGPRAGHALVPDPARAGGQRGQARGAVRPRGAGAGRLGERPGRGGGAAVAVFACAGRSKAARKYGRRRPAGHRGFGTRLVEFATTHELHGQAELTFAPEGLRAEIAFPIG